MKQTENDEMMMRALDDYLHKVYKSADEAEDRLLDEMLAKDKAEKANAKGEG